jgi:Predicted membrane protein
VVAGIADAIGYVTMGGVFAANMTGNTVLAGIDIAKGNHLGAWNHLTPLVAFFPGAMLARVMLRLLKSPVAGILLEAAIIAVVGFLPVGEQNAVMIVAFAMGLQASTITSFAGHAVSTVVVTSTLARTADAAVDRIWPRSEAPLPSATNTWLLTLTWTGYLVGAVIGGLLLPAMAYPLLVPAALLVLALLF